MSKATISVESLQLALDILDEHCRELLHVEHTGVFESFRGAASRLESEIVGAEPIRPLRLHEDLRMIADLFRSVGK